MLGAKMKGWQIKQLCLQLCLGGLISEALKELKASVSENLQEHIGHNLAKCFFCCCLFVFLQDLNTFSIAL